MPQYFRRCEKCAVAFDVIVPMRLATTIRCPKCDGEVDIDVRAQGVPAMPRMNLNGSAQISKELRIHPNEVQKARRDFGDEGGSCWQDDGHLKFTHTDQADKFFKKLKKIRTRVAEKQGAQAAVDLSSGT